MARMMTKRTARAIRPARLIPASTPGCWGVIVGVGVGSSIISPKSSAGSSFSSGAVWAACTAPSKLSGCRLPRMMILSDGDLARLSGSEVTKSSENGVLVLNSAFPIPSSPSFKGFPPPAGVAHSM